MINLCKTSVVRLAGWLNDKVEPFKELTRPLPIKSTGLSYATRADIFESDFVDRFRLPNGVYAYRIGNGLLDIGDQALWHGIATAMWAFKYTVTQAAEDEQRLLDSMIAMRQHFRGSRRWLVRGVDPFTDGCIADDASNDTATGPAAGAYFAWLLGPEPVRLIAREILVNLALELHENNHCLMRQDGTPTTYGRLVDGIKTDPIRVSLAMVIYSAAYQATLDRVFRDAYERLAKNYRELLRAPLLKALWFSHSYEAHRAALHLSIVADSGDKETRAAATEGLERILWLERKAGNSWILALASRHLALSPRDREIYRGRQLEYEPAYRGPDIEVVNTAMADFWKERGVEFAKWGDQMRATQALPYWMIASQDFYPQRHPFQADGWIGNKQPAGYHSGLDFLVSHWLGVMTGLVGRDE